MRLRTAINSAAKYHRGADLPLETKMVNLKKDLANSPYHIFGDHKNCSDYFCKRVIENEVNYVPQMKECGLFKDVLACALRLKFHAHSLLKNVNNNYAEQYNNLVAKFVGGKRINFSSRGS